VSVVLRTIGGLSSGPALLTLAVVLGASLGMAGAQMARGETALQGSKPAEVIAKREGELTVLRGQIHRWGCDKARYATSAEGCVTLNAQARKLDAAIARLKGQAGGAWTPEQQAKAEAYRAPLKPKRYTYRSRTKAGASYRTVCVRLCDGFYFPVSESVRPGQFIADEKRCQSRCQAPVGLFYHQGSAETPEAMVALTGERYGDLLNAFRYRKEYVESCACKPKPWSAVAQAVFESRAIVASRSPLERVVAAGAREVGALLAGPQQDIVAEAKARAPQDAPQEKARAPQAKSHASQSKPRYTRSAADTPAASARPRQRYRADIPPAPPRQQYFRRRGLFQPRNR